MSRIIAGSAGGRRIKTPSGPHTRPTTDRVREALFAAVAVWAGTADRAAAEALSGLAFCDLYAGSGAVGLEAASRGAGPVLLVEQHRATARQIQGTAADLGLDVRVRAADVLAVVRQPAGGAFDVVFADPPYDVPTPVLDTAVADLLTHGWVARPGLLLLERSRRSPEPVWPDPVATTWTRAYGETIVYFGVLPDLGAQS